MHSTRGSFLYEKTDRKSRVPCVCRVACVQCMLRCTLHAHRCRWMLLLSVVHVSIVSLNAGGAVCGLHRTLLSSTSICTKAARPTMRCPLSSPRRWWLRPKKNTCRSMQPSRTVRTCWQVGVGVLVRVCVCVCTVSLCGCMHVCVCVVCVYVCEVKVGFRMSNEVIRCFGFGDECT